MPNRHQAPPIQSVERIQLHRFEPHKLPNGIPVYALQLGNQNVLQIELVVEAGRWYERKQLVARATAQLLKAGTQQRSAAALASLFEHYGAKLDIYDGFNTINIQLFCLTKHAPTLVPLLRELVCEPTFPEVELAQFIKRSRQNLKLQLKKNDVVAYRLFTEELFGSDHPYGYNSYEYHYDQLQIEAIWEHYRLYYGPQNMKLFVSGKMDDKVLPLLEQHFGNLPTSMLADPPQWSLSPPTGQKSIQQVLNEDSLQTSIRIGRRLFNRTHPDCDGMYLLNMVLGGYFGGRLMQNLRERNGYTYGVYSSVETLKQSGYWYVHTDVNRDMTAPALREIYHEIERLRQELIPEQELNMVRNYTMGMQLTALDGVFNVTSVLKSILLAGLSEVHYYRFIDTIQTITPERLRELAQQYWDPTDLVEVVVQ